MCCYTELPLSQQSRLHQLQSTVDFLYAHCCCFWETSGFQTGWKWRDQVEERTPVTASVLSPTAVAVKHLIWLREAEVYPSPNELREGLRDAAERQQAASSCGTIPQMTAGGNGSLLADAVFMITLWWCKKEEGSGESSWWTAQLVHQCFSCSTVSAGNAICLQAVF